MPAIHSRPAQRQQSGPSQEQRKAAEKAFYDAMWHMFLRIIGWEWTPETQAPDAAVNDWANSLNTIDDMSNTLIQMYTPGSSLEGTAGLNQIIADMEALMGSPDGLGTGYPNAGALAGANLVASFQNFVDHLVQPLTRTTSTNNTFADVANALTGMVIAVDSVNGMAQSSSAALAKAAINQPNYHAVDPTLHGVFNLTTLTGSSASTIAVTQAKSAIGFIHVPVDCVKDSVCWQGYGVSNITGIYLNVYNVNTTTGEMTPLTTTANVVGAASSSMAWSYAALSTPITVHQGDVLAVEFVVTGAGTHTIVGMPNHWLPPNPTVFPRQLAAVRPALPPALDTVGTPSVITTETSPPFTGTVTINSTPGAAVLLILQVTGGSSGAGAYTRSARYDPGGTNIAMTSLGAINASGGGTAGFSEIFILQNAAGGSKTISWSITGGSTTWKIGVAQAVSYLGVGSVGALQYAQNISSAPDAAITSDGTQRWVNCIQGLDLASGAPTITGYAHTARDGPRALTGAFGYCQDSVIGDEVGVGTIDFSVTFGRSLYWCNMAVPLNGIVPASVSIPSPTYSPDVPWLALSSQTSSSVGKFTPDVSAFNAVGSFNYTPPSWSKFLDVVGVGGGGSGEGEVGFNMGQGGNPGQWVGQTLTAGVDYTPGVTVFSITIGPHAPGIIGYFADGNPGPNTTITWTDPSSTARSVTAPGGGGGTLSGLFGYAGAGPGNFTFAGETYFGGWTTAPGCNGNAPGGAGGGAIIFQPWSGNGAPGQAWITARQS